MNRDLLRPMLERHEGKRLKPYFCSKKHWTIGTGWNIDANPLPADIDAHLKKNGCITEEMNERLLDISIDRAINAAQRLFPRFFAIDDTRQAALIDLIFNMGEDKIRRKFPSFVAAVNAQDWQRAADEIKYSNGLKKDKLSDYWTELHGDLPGQDDGKVERPEEIYQMLKGG